MKTFAAASEATSESGAARDAKIEPAKPSALSAGAMLLWVIFSGFAGALATIGFREAIHCLQWLLVDKSGSLVEMARALPWYFRISIPAAGGVVAGYLLLLATRRTTTPSDYMDVVAKGDGRLHVYPSLLRSASSLCTIATGGSIGREGSMVQLAALGASILGSWVRLDAERLRLLVACGAAAGMTAAYNAPIAGAVFVSEIVLGSIAMSTFGPIVIAAVVANIFMRALPGYHPIYEVPRFIALSGCELPFVLALGVLCGVAGPLYFYLLKFFKRTFQQSGLSLPSRLGIGGALAGLVSVVEPQVWGNGYSVVNGLLHQPLSWAAVASVLLWKLIATAFTTGSGAIGGIFTPTLVIGAALGYLSGVAIHTVFPASSSLPFVYAIVGMGAFLGATTRAPLTAILMVFEMTAAYQIVLPLMAACVVSFAVARLFDDAAMYEITVRRGETLLSRRRLRTMQVSALLRPAMTVVRLTSEIAEIRDIFLNHAVKHVYVVDESNRYQGAISLKDMSECVARSGPDCPTAKDLLRRDTLPVLFSDMPIKETLSPFLAFHGERLPVIERAGKGARLIGVVHKSAVLDTYHQLDQSAEP